jgi:5'-deoxynucleotidase YfbR-like HD superfamily hydrolase
MSIMAWVLAREKEGALDVSRVTKIALVHDLAKVVTDDFLAMRVFFSCGRKRTSELATKWPRLSQGEKNKILKKQYAEEERTVQKVTGVLGTKLGSELFSLWLDYEGRGSREARFVNQIGALENLMQALEYRERNKRFMIEPWLLHAKKHIDDSLLLKVLETLEDQLGETVNFTKQRIKQRKRRKQ